MASAKPKHPASSAAEILKGQGNAAFKTGKYQVAIEYYSSAMKADPSDHILPCNRAMARLKINQWKAAEADCTKSLDLLPEGNCKALFRRGIARKNLKLWDEALQDLIAASKLEPSNSSIVSELDEVRSQTKTSLPEGESPVPSSSASKASSSKKPQNKSVASSEDSSSDESSESSAEKAHREPLESIVAGDGFLREISSRKIDSSKPAAQNSDSSLPSFGELKQLRQKKEDKAYSVRRPDSLFNIQPKKVMLKSDSSGSNNPQISLGGATGCKSSRVSIAPIHKFSDFERRWTSSTSREARWTVLEALDPQSLREMFGEHLEPDVLEQILEAIDYATKLDDDKTERAIYLIKGLDRVSRLGTLTMFLDTKNLEIVKKVVGIYSKKFPTKFPIRLENWGIHQN